MFFDRTATIIILTVVFSGGNFSDEPECDFRGTNYSKRQWCTGPLTSYEAFGNVEVTPITFPGYRAMKVWFLSRHGTRYPGKKIVEGMFNTLPEIRDSLRSQKGSPCYNDGLVTWFPLSVLAKGETRNLTEEGKRSVNCMGRRFRKRFPNLIPDRLDFRTTVRYTKISRTKESALHFVNGLFGQISANEEWRYFSSEVDPFEDKVLKVESVVNAPRRSVFLVGFESARRILFDSACFWWKYEREERNEATLEAFKIGDDMRKVVEGVSERCSLRDFDFKKLILIHETCSFELAWFNSSPWCTLLEESELKVVEYAQDLELYAVDGYGDKWNHKIACPLFNDMHGFLTSTSDVVVHISFTHLSVVVKFLAHLGLYRGVELRADNYKDEEVQERIWRASHFAGFNANFTFVLYQNEEGERAVLCMLNERVVRIPGCPTDVDLCPLEKFEEIFHKSIHKCFYEKWCRNKEYEDRHKAYIAQKRKKQFVNVLDDDYDD